VTAAAPSRLPRLDANVPSSARICDYLLGGSHNFAADRAAARELIAAFPALPQVLATGRAFVRRATRYLAAEQGISQFLDLGSGIPTARNVHEVAQAVNPAARVGYVDLDPVAVAHCRSVLRGVGSAACVQGDLLDPAAIRADPAIRAVIDFTRPVAFILTAVLHLVPGDELARRAVAGYLTAAAPGSCVVISHHSSDSTRPDEALAREIYRAAVRPLVPRSRDQVAALFGGAELLPPGLVLTPRWRPDPAGSPDPATGGQLHFGYAGIGRTH
jgi:S-adenosyl methyltransferase